MKRLVVLAIVMLATMSMLLLALPMVSAGSACMCLPATPTPAPLIPDTQVNMAQSVSFNDSDVGVALFKTQDDPTNIKMDVYGLNNKSLAGNYLFTISQSDIAPYAAHLPTKNILLASSDGVSVYVLTTGEIQINAGPDSEGKMHVKILDGIPWTKVYGYTVDAK